MNDSPRIFVARTDRLGDVMMAVPTLEYLRAALPKAEIELLVQPMYAEVLAPYLSSREISTVKVQAGNYDGALMLFAEPRVMAAAALSRVPVRVGPLSKFPSYLFLNRGERQRRSRGDRNEAEYNLALARRLVKELTGETKDFVPEKVVIPADAEAARAAASLVGAEPYAVLHPGMGGSALNLSAERYSDLVGEIERAYRTPVVLTEGPSPHDREIVAGIVKLRPRIRVLRGMKLTTLREVFRAARVVAAPSTGPLHLAHFTGAETIGLYSPVRSQRKERWAPWGGKGKVTVISPDVECPGTRECIGATCPNYFCMERMDHGLRG